MNLNYIRPSTLARVVEDAVLGTLGYVNNLRRTFVHAYSTEYSARKAYQFAREVQQADEAEASMTAAQRKVFERDLAEVNARVEELLAKNAAKRAYKAARA